MALRSSERWRLGSTNQVLVSAIALGICVVVAAWIIALREREHQEQAKRWAMQRFGLLSATTNSLHDDYQDLDRDLIADAPTEMTQWIRPDTLTFSYVVSAGPEGQAAVWQSLMDEISAATGLPVEFRQLENLEEQLAAIRSGDLHITGLNTGSVPRAVNVCGFVPFGTLAGTDAAVGLRSLIIVPTDSTINKVEDLKGKLITFTTQSSNSGFKAPLALLSKELGMNPAIDYEYAFAGGHDKAIELVAANQAAVAAVASDLLDRAIRRGTIKEDQYRVIYESERFPPAAFGHIHNLDPEIAMKIRTVMTDHELPEGPLRELFAHIPGARIVPVTYKDDWALIRRIDNSLGVVHALPDGAAPAATETALAEPAEGEATETAEVASDNSDPLAPATDSAVDEGQEASEPVSSDEQNVEPASSGS